MPVFEGERHVTLPPRRGEDAADLIEVFAELLRRKDEGGRAPPEGVYDLSDDPLWICDSDQHELAAFTQLPCLERAPAGVVRVFQAEVSEPSAVRLLREAERLPSRALAVVL